MRLLVKNTQTSIGSWISTILRFSVYRRKPKGQEGIRVKRSESRMKLFISLILTALFLLLTPAAHAIVDPLSVPNNKFGIHIISASIDEASPAAELVNTSGDWGYITILIESKDRNQNKWQEFFMELRRRHLIPLVRLATKPINDYWERPYEGEEVAWADFLDNLLWPTKNRYIIVYNEPNHGKEWGGTVDAKMYAKVLDKTITTLKTKNRDFFVLNGGFDASAPSKPPNFEDQVNFMRQMDEAVPGIFNKLDGWVSHSYPNPDFAGSPATSGRGTIRTWFWELQLLRSLGVTKNLPVFITETGWKHAEGINYNPNYPTAELVAGYFQQAFEDAWASSKIIAVTPFLLNYQEEPFDHFSFKKITGEKQKRKLLSATEVLGSQYPEYYPQYQVLRDLPKIKGQPVQENKAQLQKGEIFSSIVAGETYNISLIFKNTGQSIWNDREPVKFMATEGGRELGLEEIEIPEDVKIGPGNQFTFNLKIKAPQSGTFKVTINLFEGQKQFDSPPFEFQTTVKQPVILQVKSTLKWKKSYQGEYYLRIEGAVGESVEKVYLSKEGISGEMEARYLLPDYTFDFSLKKPFYKPSTITKKVSPGINILDLGVLEPDFISVLFKPAEFWKLLPFSN